MKKIESGRRCTWDQVFERVKVEGEKRDKRNGQALSLNITYGSAPCSSSSDTIFTFAKPVAMISAVMCPVTPRLRRPSFRTRDWRHRERWCSLEICCTSSSRSFMTVISLNIAAYAKIGIRARSNQRSSCLHRRQFCLKFEADLHFRTSLPGRLRSHHCSQHTVARASAIASTSCWWKSVSTLL